MSPANKAARDAARDGIVRGHILRHVQGVFSARPEVQTAVLCVAQYADAESHDGVHGELVFSDLREPSIQPPTGMVESVQWENNRDAISLFVAWCSEGGEDRAIVLYRREGAEVTWVAEPVRPELDGVEPLPAKTALDRARMRDELVRGSILTQVRGQFFARPTLQSAWLAVSQYWDDEAEDAVHGMLIFSQLPEPSLDGWRADEAWWHWKVYSAHKALAAAGEAPASDNVRGLAHFDVDSPFCLSESGTAMVRWHDNGDAIPLFAAWCAEGSDQEMLTSDAYRPIVLYQRASDDITVTWIAEPLRPWLEGVPAIDPQMLCERQMINRQALDATREATVRGPILQQVRELFAAQPTLQSAYLTVSQYWDDEADDAVHGELLFSQLPEPSLDGFRADEAWVDDNEAWQAKAALAAAGEAPLSDNLRGMKLHNDNSTFNLWSVGSVPVAHWDDNGDAIPLFAAWCDEGSDQEMPRSEAYRPIVLYQRAGIYIVTHQRAGYATTPVSRVPAAQPTKTLRLRPRRQLPGSPCRPPA